LRDCHIIPSMSSPCSRMTSQGLIRGEPFDRIVPTRQRPVVRRSVLDERLNQVAAAEDRDVPARLLLELGDLFGLLPLMSVEFCHATFRSVVDATYLGVLFRWRAYRTGSSPSTRTASAQIDKEPVSRPERPREAPILPGRWAREPTWRFTAHLTRAPVEDQLASIRVCACLCGIGAARWQTLSQMILRTRRTSTPRRINGRKRPEPKMLPGAGMSAEDFQLCSSGPHDMPPCFKHVGIANTRAFPF
jgi:hypothetical protein